MHRHTPSLLAAGYKGGRMSMRENLRPDKVSKPLNARLCHLARIYKSVQACTDSKAERNSLRRGKTTAIGVIFACGNHRKQAGFIIEHYFSAILNQIRGET